MLAIYAIPLLTIGLRRILIQRATAIEDSCMKETVGIGLLRIAFGTVGRVFPSLASRIAFELLTTPRHFPRPERETEWLQTATPLNLECGLAAWSWGEETAPAVLLVHGWEGRGSQLGAFAVPLVERGRRVIALDAPAHGDSPGRRSDPYHYSDGVSAAAREIGPLEAIIGHSFGAAAATIAISNGLEVQKMVYAGGPATYIRAINDFFRDTLRMPPSIFSRFIERVDSQMGSPAEDLCIPRLAREIKIPALIVHGHKDVEVPFAEGQQVADAWPRSRMAAFEDLGHHNILWHPSSVAAVVDFITERTDSPSSVNAATLVSSKSSTGCPTRQSGE